MSIRFKIDGYSHSVIGAKSRLEQEFIRLGHILDIYRPQLLINLNGLFHETEFFYDRLMWDKENRDCIRFYNLLDANNNEVGFYDGCKADLEKCEIATTISNVAKNQIESKLGLKRKLEVIGYPIQDITDLKFKKTLAFGTVGRLESYKRFDLIGSTLDVMGVPRSSLAVVGPDRPNFGTYGGLLDNEMLNVFYNSTKFIFCLSQKEFLYLPLIESCIPSGTYPICCDDNPIVKELGLEDFACYPNPKEIALKINDIETNPEKYDQILDKLRPQFIEKYSVQNITKKILDLYYNFVNNRHD